MHARASTMLPSLFYYMCFYPYITYVRFSILFSFLILQLICLSHCTFRHNYHHDVYQRNQKLKMCVCVCVWARREKSREITNKPNNREEVKEEWRRHEELHSTAGNPLISEHHECHVLHLISGLKP